jgi:hypothetical protein
VALRHTTIVAMIAIGDGHTHQFRHCADIRVGCCINVNVSAIDV